MKYFLSKFRIELIVGFIILLMLGLVVWSVYHVETYEKPKAYAAWCKETGNPKELTYDEWRSLQRLKEEQSNKTYIYPQPIVIGK